MMTWVILAGLPGTGKSTLARALVEQLGGVVLDKDRVREALFSAPLTDYVREQDDLCMRAIFEAAAYLTRRARPSLNGIIDHPRLKITNAPHPRQARAGIASPATRPPRRLATPMSLC